MLTTREGVAYETVLLPAEAKTGVLVIAKRGARHG
jgi:hypothetical protein